MVREYRERAMARRLDRDGARLEKYTKKQKVIPVGDTVAVQNQTGRFPKKWDKTGTVVENQKYDKVLVKLDGSGRLTTRNRQFVKKIVSPPDLPQVSGPNTGTPVVVHDDTKTVDEENIVPVPMLDATNVDNIVEDYHIEIENENEAEGGTDVMMGGEVDMNAQTDSDWNGRPKRDRRQNVRYSSEEYDLSKVSTRATLKLSGIYVQPKAVKLTQENRIRKKI